MKTDLARPPFRIQPWLLVLILCGGSGQQVRAQETPAPPPGYYRFPAIHESNLVFTAEGDLWTVGIRGGVARRLTTHPGNETHAAFSPDGRTVAFAADYEGATEVYTMPAAGGLPVRRTFEEVSSESIGWMPDGRLLYATHVRSHLPDAQTTVLDLSTGQGEVLPLSQAAAGVFEETGKTFFFTRLPFNRGSVKRYKGGTAENLWRYTLGEPEARPLTSDFTGTSRAPMWWRNRLYFVSDRDGTLNLWSMNRDGGELRQHTKHQGWDVKWPALSAGRIAYQLGADLRLYEIATDKDGPIPIQLASDFDHQREKWVKKPLDYVSTVHLSPQGDRVVLTARGQVFVAPVGPGRLVEVTRRANVRHRFAVFLGDSTNVVALSDESGEVEFVKLPANGVGSSQALTQGGKVLRFGAEPSPDGKFLAWSDKDQKLWLLQLETKDLRMITESPHDRPAGLAWSPDSRWLAYVSSAENQFTQIWIYNLADETKTALTSERVDSREPNWSPDGKWLYFLSDRQLESAVSSPWGPRQPEPYFERTTKIYAAALTAGLRSPFEPPDELHSGKSAKKNDTAKEKVSESDKEKKEPSDKDAKGSAADKGDAATKAAASSNKTVEVTIELAGLPTRLWEVPVPAGNYFGLSVNEKRLFWESADRGEDSKVQLRVLEIGNDDPKPKTFTEEIRSYEMSMDGKKLLIRKGDQFHVEDAAASPPAKLEKSLDLKGWSFPLDPRDEWRQMFVEAWRLERDYFYDRKMHGVDWPAVLKKYLPTVERVTDRAELSDLIGDMVSELAALHIRVVGGDRRRGPDQVVPSGLGATLVRAEKEGGWRVEHIHQTDPEYPNKLSPLLRPGVEMQEGDIIELINGVPTLSVVHPQMLLRNQADKQVLLRVKPKSGGTSREVIVKPMTPGQEIDLRYAEWEFTRRQKVEELGKGDLGYVHLRAMGQSDVGQWARDYYPVYNRKGLIVDVRHNGGGNIDSWILGKLMRKAWFFWQPRVGSPTWNMHYAFRGHMVVLCDEHTGSDGEAFTEGFRRLGLGKVIGTRTWGGEIWLSASNFLVDQGIATSAEIGVYGPEGQWLIEGHGVDPDIVVDNLPHATFEGRDAQLERAISHLQEEIRTKPIPNPTTPAYPDKSAPLTGASASR